jgi:four helix bundle protein
MDTERSLVYEKAESFSVRIVKLHKYLTVEKREFEISSQIKRSGTSIAANIVEALYAESKKDFIHKLNIAEKECNETKYWLKVLYKTEYLNRVEYESIIKDCMELVRMLAAIIRTSKGNLQHS